MSIVQQGTLAVRAGGTDEEPVFVQRPYAVQRGEEGLGAAESFHCLHCNTVTDADTAAFAGHPCSAKPAEITAGGKRPRPAGGASRTNTTTTDKEG